MSTEKNFKELIYLPTFNESWMKKPWVVNENNLKK